MTNLASQPSPVNSSGDHDAHAADVKTVGYVELRRFVHAVAPLLAGRQKAQVLPKEREPAGASDVHATSIRQTRGQARWAPGGWGGTVPGTGHARHLEDRQHGTAHAVRIDGSRCLKARLTIVHGARRLRAIALGRRRMRVNAASHRHNITRRLDGYSS